GRGAGGIRRGRARRGRAGDGRRACHRVPRGDPRRHPLRARGTLRRSQGGIGMRIIAALLACTALAAGADEAAFPPRKPVEITCLFPAGSSADVTARMLADGMSKALNQRVLVIDKPGAGGAIGYKFVAGQKPDGYSLVWNSNSISTTHHSGQLDIDYRAF